MTNDTEFPAKTVAEAYRACNPDEALQPEDPRYVDFSEVRSDDMLSEIGWKITVSGNDCLNKLVTGHRGSGKTTELLRLKKELETQDLFVIYADIEDMLDLGDISYLDVLLAITRALADALEDEGIETEEKLFKDIEQWFSDRIITKTFEDSDSLGAKTEAGASVGFGLAKIFGKLTAELKSASSRRVEIREQLDRNVTQFLRYLDVYITDAKIKLQEKGKSNLVFIIDGLEKTVHREGDNGRSNYYDLFIHHAEQLKAPNCHLVYTVPISLVFDTQLGDQWPDDYYLVPMVNPSDKGTKKLLEAVQKRIDIDEVFETQDTIDDFIKISGGALRDILRLIRMASGPGDRISTGSGAQAIGRFLQMEDRLIRDSYKTLLTKVAKERKMPNDPEYEKLLHNRLVHEYQNGTRWADVHPAIKILLDLDGKPVLKTHPGTSK